MIRLVVTAPVAALLVSALTAGCATTHEANWAERPVVAAAPAAAGAAVAAAAEGDELWKQRGDKAKLTAALAKWEEAAKAAPTAELAAKLARGHYLLGDGYLALEDDAAGRDAEYQKGLDWATTALKLAAPDFAAAMAAGGKHVDAIKLAPKEAVPAMYWYASNLGKWAASKGFATKLKYKDDLKATMEHVKSLAPDFFYAAAWRYFGGYEAATAGIAGGSLDRSKEDFEKAIQLAPNYFGTKVLYADYLCTKLQKDTDGDGVPDGKKKFKELLDGVMAADPNVDPDIAPENTIEQAKAKKLLAQIDQLFAG
jgi:tetratricopeptide (TPR) repeat protein